VCLGYVYRDNESLIDVDILRNEISVKRTSRKCVTLMIYLSKVEETFQVSGEAKSALKTYLM
jgi:hypothetical protein